MRLVAYSDATSFGGAEQVLANLLEALDPAYEIRVLAVDRAVGEAIAPQHAPSFSFICSPA